MGIHALSAKFSPHAVDDSIFSAVLILLSTVDRASSFLMCLFGRATGTYAQHGQRQDTTALSIYSVLRTPLVVDHSGCFDPSLFDVRHC